MNKQYASSVGESELKLFRFCFRSLSSCAFYIFPIEDERAWRLHLDVSPGSAGPELLRLVSHEAPEDPRPATGAGTKSVARLLFLLRMRHMEVCGKMKLVCKLFRSRGARIGETRPSLLGAEMLRSLGLGPPS